MSCLAIIDAAIRLFAQVDLKRVVALTTVIEMNWLNLCYVLGDPNLSHLAHFIIVVHCFTTASEFLLVEFVTKRYSSRNYWQIAGLWYRTPLLWYLSFIVVFTTIGLPGTSIFFAKFVFLSAALSYSYGIFIFFLFIFFLVLPLFFVRL
jgi:NADH:ubiquinone oxidoreductase subunit 4 (subunit M)